jgi:hypothetical protein
VADANAPKASARNEFVNRGRAKPEAVSYLADAEKALTDSGNCRRSRLIVPALAALMQHKKR